MASRLYELKVHRNMRQIGGVNPFVIALDLSQPGVAAAHLDRHLLGAVLRDGANREEAHLYHVEVRDTDGYGKGTGQALFRWPLPAGGEIPNGWPQN
jgi:hypothetical protein